MQTWEPDPKVSGLYKRIGSSKTVWAVKARIKGGNPITVTLGRVDVLSAAVARKEAHSKLAQLAAGINPNEEARASQKQKRLSAEADAARGLTLRQALLEYLNLKELKPATVKSYNTTIERNFEDWLDQPLREITRDDVLERYQTIKKRVAGKKRLETTSFANPAGEGEAQRAFRYLGAVINSFANDVVGGKPLLDFNPVDVLKHKKVRKLLRARKRYLTPHQLQELRYIAEHCSHPEWKGATTEEDADFVMLLLMTGLRVDELRTLAWKNVDFSEGTLKAVDTKNRNEHILPLTGSIGHVLKRRKKGNSSSYVFPSPLTPNQPASMSRALDRVCADLGVVFTPHDLRRTFATVASEMGVDIAKIGDALNHTKSGITSRYIQATPTMLAQTLQAVQDALFEDHESES